MLSIRRFSNFGLEYLLQKYFIAQHNELKHGKKVHLGRTMHCLPQRLKSMFFEKIFSSNAPEQPGVMKKTFQKTLILASLR